MAIISQNSIKNGFLSYLAEIRGKSHFYERIPDVSQAQHDKMGRNRG